MSVGNSRKLHAQKFFFKAETMGVVIKICARHLGSKMNLCHWHACVYYNACMIAWWCVAWCVYVRVCHVHLMHTHVCVMHVHVSHITYYGILIRVLNVIHDHAEAPAWLANAFERVAGRPFRRGFVLDHHWCMQSLFSPARPSARCLLFGLGENLSEEGAHEKEYWKITEVMAIVHHHHYHTATTIIPPQENKTGGLWTCMFVTCNVAEGMAGKTTEGRHSWTHTNGGFNAVDVGEIQQAVDECAVTYILHVCGSIFLYTKISTYIRDSICLKRGEII